MPNLSLFASATVLFSLLCGCSTAPSVSAPLATPNTVPPTSIPRPDLSPGVALPNLTTATVCQKGYAGSVRNVTQATKNWVFQEYGITPNQHTPGSYEIDHIISLELGGSNDIHNLFPQPYFGPWNAHDKDRVEDRLHALVCQGKLTLKQAQDMISQNWVGAYLQLFPGELPESVKNSIQTTTPSPTP